MAIAACLSPLCTSAYLWQLKEWRWDRLLEHLKREQWFVLLFGKLRPVVIALYIITLFLQIPLYWSVLGALLLLTALNAAQILLRKQRMPVWTQKARVLVAASMLLTIAAAAFLLTQRQWMMALPFLALAQPLMLVVARILFQPIDQFLKQRIIAEARAVREANPDLLVIAVTGSVGKTTTKELLAHVLQDLEPLATPAHVNTEIGVAQWMTRSLPAYVAKRTTPGILIVEMGAYRTGEIALMSSYVQQNIGVVTYVGSQHLALFGSPEALFQAKSELVRALPARGHAFLNGDNARCRKMAELCPCPVTIVGTGGVADLEAFDISETRTGIRFTVRGRTVDVPIHGTHNVINVLLAMGVAEHLGQSTEMIIKKLQTFLPPSKTFEVREEKGVRILDDTHNSSTSSFKAAIAWAKTQPYQKKVLLATGLIELGEEQERAEHELGALAGKVFERIVIIDKRSAKVFSEGAGSPVETLGNATERIDADTLLVCVGKMPQSTVRRLLPTS